MDIGMINFVTAILQTNIWMMLWVMMLLPIDLMTSNE